MESFRNGVLIPSYYDPEFGYHHNITNETDPFSGVNDTVDPNAGRYLSSLGVWLAIPEWEVGENMAWHWFGNLFWFLLHICLYYSQAALTAVTLSLIIVLTVVGNILVILSVFTYRPLRSAPNFFIVSLAVADLTVAVLVLPLNVAHQILGRWVLGKYICEFWLTSDVLCCTGEVTRFILRQLYNWGEQVC